MYSILNGCIYITNMGFGPNSYTRKIEKVWTTAKGNKRDINNNTNSASINEVKIGNIAANNYLIKEIDIKTQKFWSFLPKLKLINWLILYKTNFSFFLYIIISFSIYNIDFFSCHTSYNNLIIINFYYFIFI